MKTVCWLHEAAGVKERLCTLPDSDKNPNRTHKVAGKLFACSMVS